MRRCVLLRPRRGPPTGSDERLAGTAFSRTAGPSVSALGTVILRVYIEARTIPSTPRSCIASISCCSRSGSPSVSPMKRRCPRSRAASSAPQIRWPANGRGRDGVGDEADRLARAGAKAPRDDVRPVAGLADRLQNPRFDVGGDPHLLAPAGEHERRRGLGDAGAPGDVGKRDPGRTRVPNRPSRCRRPLTSAPRSPIIPHVLIRFSNVHVRVSQPQSASSLVIAPAARTK